jgi:hypothetical protein
MRLKRLIDGPPILLLLLALPALSFSDQPLPDEQPQAAEAQAEAGGEKQETEEVEGPTLDERLDALLSEVSAYEEHSPQRCLNTRTYRTVKVLNTEHLLFSRGTKHWLNKLKRDCPSLKWNDLPVFESRGTISLCENDPFYPSNSMDLQRGLSGGRPVAMHGTCFLGSFQQITPEQVALLTEQN